MSELDADTHTRSLAPDAGLALANDQCFCVSPTIATNEHGETWCSVCGERLLLAYEPCPWCASPAFGLPCLTHGANFSSATRPEGAIE